MEYGEYNTCSLADQKKAIKFKHQGWGIWISKTVYAKHKKKSQDWEESWYNDNWQSTTQWSSGFRILSFSKNVNENIGGFNVELPALYPAKYGDSRHQL